MTLTTEDLLELLASNCARDVSRIGRANVRMIVEDFVAFGPDAKRFETPGAGHHFDLTAALGIVVGLLQLFVAVGDIAVREVRRRKELSDDALVSIVRPQLENLDLTRIPDEEKLIIDAIEIARRHVR